MRHFNGDIPCVVDTETTGFDPRTFDIVSMCILPLHPETLDIHPKIGAFDILIKPKRPENIDFDAIRIQRQNNHMGDADDIVFVKEYIAKICREGLEPDYAKTLLYEWFQSLKLRPTKRIIPIAHNWPFDREHLIEWLGYNGFGFIFQHQYRDTMPITLFLNDVADWHGNEYPFQHHKLNALCNAMGIKRDRKHTALDDCVDTQKLYKALVKREIPLKVNVIEPLSK